ncbi:MAG: hypothetical protein HZB46_06745, partial [Solirubrobacterales bacterium]|nr:hypothetical protein [Solirubrobacterales bacterium]
MRPLLPLAAALLVLAFAGAAGAAQVARDGDTVVYTAAPGEGNRVLANVGAYDSSCGGLAPPCLTLFESGARITAASGGCVVTPGGFAGDTAACPMPTAVRAELGDGDDAWWDWEGPTTIDAGTGNDNPITGGPGDDRLAGGPGNDVLEGGPGNDVLDGGLGDDDLEGIPGGDPGAATTAGADTYAGGGGYDVVTYEDRTEPLALSPDGVANDGAAGEGDDIGTDVTGTGIVGGVGDDTISGGPARSLLSGGPGDDLVDGGAGDDSLGGDTGNDRVLGGAGQDLVVGSDGNDVVDGGGDVDQLWGDDPLGCSPYACPSGRDRILARDGLAEPVDCGPGIDEVQGDAADMLRSYPLSSDVCETVDLAGAAAPGTGGSGTPAAPGAATGAPLAIAGAAAERGRRIVLRLTVTAPGTITARAT